MDQQLNIPRRILTGLISSLSAGVVPRVGAPYIAIGRNREIEALAGDLDEIADGGSKTRFLIGKYGSGKSFLIQLVRGYALDRGFVCADCDLSPERKLCGASGTGAATYRELMKNLSTKTSPDGGGLETLVARWLDRCRAEIAGQGLAPDSAEFDAALTSRVYGIASLMEGQVGGFDFSRVLFTYYKASKEEDLFKRSACLRWLRGEYTTKTEARRDLGVGSVIGDDNWFDYIKLFALFVRQVGFKGLVCFFDECVNLYKTVNRISRENNYEKLLSMYNDSLQGRAPCLGLVFGGTPAFLEDTRRGLYSYEALKSRLYDGRIASAGGLTNLMGPIIRLKRMSDNELLALCGRIAILHEKLHGVPSRLTPGETAQFLKICLDRPGAENLITPREIIREYITVLDVMLQNPQATFAQVSGNISPTPDVEKANAENGPIISDFDV
ncbi:MAG: ATP-binding protein [Clostridia bacterium]|nr:ATP-binding protein [Clostridia bacterium]